MTELTLTQCASELSNCSNCSCYIFTELIPPSYQDPKDDGAKPAQMLKCEWVYPLVYKTACMNVCIIAVKKQFLTVVSKVPSREIYILMFDD